MVFLYIVPLDPALKGGDYRGLSVQTIIMGKEGSLSRGEKTFD
jgi:hypothetical protein